MYQVPTITKFSTLFAVPTLMSLGLQGQRPGAQRYGVRLESERHGVRSPLCPGGSGTSLQQWYCHGTPPASVFCGKPRDWQVPCQYTVSGRQIWSGTCVSERLCVQLSERIRPWDTLSTWLRLNVTKKQTNNNNNNNKKEEFQWPFWQPCKGTESGSGGGREYWNWTHNPLLAAPPPPPPPPPAHSSLPNIVLSCWSDHM